MHSKIMKENLSNIFVKSFSFLELNEFAKELRKIIIEIVAKNGGHLASNLGTIELTLALHYVFDLPNDKILWDVGHQAYSHKIITGRQIRFKKLRKSGGLSGFSKKSESIYDVFTTGHSSTSISAGLGLACAKFLKGEESKIISIVGDGSLTSGLAYEGLNQIATLNKVRNFVLVVNDNKMSISNSVGSLQILLNNAILRGKPKNCMKLGCIINKNLHNKECYSDVFFNILNLNYFGPIDGHNIESLIYVLKKIKRVKKPVVLHVLTKKGSGYCFSEESPTYFHGINKFDVNTGLCNKNKDIYFTTVFGETINELASRNKNIVAITAAMTKGTGLDLFKKNHPNRFFDVGIAEQHSVTFAAGMSAEGYIPILTIYSTFLQRAYDQVLHDVCIEKLHVIFALDRGGLVGEDGVTHHGVFDLSYLRSIPNMVIMAPKDENELRNMFYTTVFYNGPISFRFPKGKILGVPMDVKMKRVNIGRGEILSVGEKAALIAIGSTVKEAKIAARFLRKTYNISVTVVNARFVKPLDKRLLIGLCRKFRVIVTVEENMLSGGFGSAVLELLADNNVKINIFKRIGINNVFVGHGNHSKLKSRYFVDSKFIIKTVIKAINLEKIYVKKK